MAILSTVKKVIPYIKEAAGYVLCHISSQAVEMDDGTLLQDKIESMDSEIDGKANTSHTHTATQVKGLTASRALVSNSSGQPSVSNVTSTELNYLDGVTSNIQNQINTLNSNLKKHFAQGGIANTNNINGYFRSVRITFPVKYKTVPNVVATVMNHENNYIDARLCTLVQNINTTNATIYVADQGGEIATQGYQVQWIAVGEIN